MRTRLCVTWILLVSGVFGADGAFGGARDDWPSWAGPNLDLTSTAKRVFPKSGFGLTRRWSRSIGPGYSGVLVVGRRAVTAFSDGTSDVVVALDASTGEEIWRYRIGETYRGHDGSEDGPLTTPSVHKRVVYGLGGSGELFALRLADGEELWEGNEPVTAQIPGGSGWRTWRRQTDRVLEALFPLGGSSP